MKTEKSALVELLENDSHLRPNVQDVKLMENMMLFPTERLSFTHESVSKCPDGRTFSTIGILRYPRLCGDVTCSFTIGKIFMEDRLLKFGRFSFAQVHCVLMAANAEVVVVVDGENGQLLDRSEYVPVPYEGSSITLDEADSRPVSNEGRERESQPNENIPASIEVVIISEPTAKKAKLKKCKEDFIVFGFVSVDSKPMYLEYNAIMTNYSMKNVKLEQHQKLRHPSSVGKGREYFENKKKIQLIKLPDFVKKINIEKVKILKPSYLVSEIIAKVAAPQI
ncbi:Hypothetical predicted protein [Octopus vulgaris]|uniref:Uncharacterized protein n=1 Tax=Octopus vulgaris TaxID=6645 RepID=A0AA36F0V9_OCTVU|nr:Hypothetical predicted protein [Octopus vulgaris]